MKKLITLLLIVTSLNVFGQKKDSVLTDSTKFLSVADINRLGEKYKDKATFRQYESFMMIMKEILRDAIEERKKKPQ